MEIFGLEEGKICRQDTIKMEEQSSYWIKCTPEELKSINSQFQFRESFVHECSNEGHETGIEIYQDYYFGILNLIHLENNVIRFDELNFFCGKNYLVTVVKKDFQFLDRIASEIQENGNGLLYKTHDLAHRILFIILDRLSMACFETVTALDKTLGAIEEKILRSTSKKSIEHFVGLKRQVLKIRRYIKPLQYVGDVLILNEMEIFDGRMMKFLNNAHLKFAQLENEMDQLNQSVISLREAYEAEVSNQLNEIMKVFTIVSAVFLPLNLMAGIFGMNFEYIPFTRAKLGFPILMFLMGGITAVEFIFFKKRKWL